MQIKRAGMQKILNIWHLLLIIGVIVASFIFCSCLKYAILHHSNKDQFEGAGYFYEDANALALKMQVVTCIKVATCWSWIWFCHEFGNISAWCHCVWKLGWLLLHILGWLEIESISTKSARLKRSVVCVLFIFSHVFDDSFEVLADVFLLFLLSSSLPFISQLIESEVASLWISSVFRLELLPPESLTPLNFQQEVFRRWLILYLINFCLHFWHFSHN